MAKYFIDTEFLEGAQYKRFLGIKYGQTKPTIDLISIALVGEDGREYYAISKDFNLKEAWNRFDLVNDYDVNGDLVENVKKVYWIRENVLKPIYDDLCAKRGTYEKTYHWGLSEPFSYKSMKYLINRYGKTNKQIAEDIKSIFSPDKVKHTGNYPNTYPKDIEFYGYFADYDWVAFCWLFGRVMDLPKGFPMYCIDLKQKLDERLKTYTSIELSKAVCPSCKHNVYEAIDYKKPLITMQGCIKDHPNYPKQTNNHNALADARWNRELYKFLESL